MTPEDNELIQYVIDFWFGKPTDDDYLQPKSFWYGKPEDDEYVREKLGPLCEKARLGELAHWSQEADGALALIILLDQVPRNIYRNKPEQYECDDLALQVAKEMVEKGWDKDQPKVVRRYIYSPFNHSENLADQERSVELYRDIGDPEYLYWANSFHEVIKRYGRFRHRDRILGRA